MTIRNIHEPQGPQRSPQLREVLDAPVNMAIEKCLICSEGFGKDSAATKLPCSHLFHDHCYSKSALTKLNCRHYQAYPFKLNK